MTLTSNWVSKYHPVAVTHWLINHHVTTNFVSTKHNVISITCSLVQVHKQYYITATSSLLECHTTQQLTAHLKEACMHMVNNVSQNRVVAESCVSSQGFRFYDAQPFWQVQNWTSLGRGSHFVSHWQIQNKTSLVMGSHWQVQNRTSLVGSDIDRYKTGLF